MEIEQTHRGFDYISFVDLYENDCCLQKSSLASEDAIWFGPDNQVIKQLIPGSGWTEIELPENSHIFPGRMHLSRDQVKELIPYLQKFVETGDLK